MSVIFLISLKANVIDKVIINGNSMEKTYKNGDVVWVEKITKHYDIKRNDVIIIKERGQLLIKRVIGLPNETVNIVDGVIYINGVLLDDNIGDKMNNGGLAAEPFYLNEKEYFVLGDNRNESLDSREIGAIKKSKIVGKPIFRFFPLNRIGKI